ncbi:MAG: hypothetical protein CL902_00750 [Dehalococcoidia bacterium]|nr:hypothetical protein [Dehalococcoidia bacterium]
MLSPSSIIDAEDFVGHRLVGFRRLYNATKLHPSLQGGRGKGRGRILRVGERFAEGAKTWFTRTKGKNKSVHRATEPAKEEKSEYEILEEATDIGGKIKAAKTVMARRGWKSRKYPWLHTYEALLQQVVLQNSDDKIAKALKEQRVAKHNLKAEMEGQKLKMQEELELTMTRSAEQKETLDAKIKSFETLLDEKTREVNRLLATDADQKAEIEQLNKDLISMTENYAKMTAQKKSLEEQLKRFFDKVGRHTQSATDDFKELQTVLVETEEFLQTLPDAKEGAVDQNNDPITTADPMVADHKNPSAPPMIAENPQDSPMEKKFQGSYTAAENADAKSK